MSKLRRILGGAIGGVFAYLVATQLALLTAGQDSISSSLATLLGLLAAAILVAAAVLAGRRWPTAALGGAAVMAFLVLVSSFTVDGAVPVGMLVNFTDLMRYGASSPLPIAIAAAGGVVALSGKGPRSRAGDTTARRTPAAH